MFSVTQKVEKYMSLIVTHECNKACPFCIDEYRGSGEYITMETVHKSLSIARGRGVNDILIVGGEPTIHPEIVQIAEVVKSLGFRSIMTTNYTRPDVVLALDGIIDCFNISHYEQDNLPEQRNMTSDITIHALIHREKLSNKKELDEFINKFCRFGHLKFSTLTACNSWAKRNQVGDYLNSLDCEWVILFNEMLGQIYKGCVIKRYDKILTTNASQSLKAHVDGELSFSWQRTSALAKAI